MLDGKSDFICKLRNAQTGRLSSRKGHLTATNAGELLERACPDVASAVSLALLFHRPENVVRLEAVLFAHCLRPEQLILHAAGPECGSVVALTSFFSSLEDRGRGVFSPRPPPFARARLPSATPSAPRVRALSFIFHGHIVGEGPLGGARRRRWVRGAVNMAEALGYRRLELCVTGATVRRGEPFLQKLIVELADELAGGDTQLRGVVLTSAEKRKDATRRRALWEWRDGAVTRVARPISAKRALSEALDHLAQSLACDPLALADY